MAQPMEILEQAWRRALALTGTAAGADAALEAVLRGVSNPAKASESRMLGIVIGQARGGAEAVPAPGLGHAVLGGELAAKAANLEGPVREAWVLRSVCDVEVSEAAAAMDMPDFQLESLAVRGEALVKAAAGDEAYRRLMAEARQRLGQAAAGEAVAGVWERTADVRRKRKMVGVVQFIIFAICVGAMVYVFYDLRKAQNKEREESRFSLPAEPVARPK